MFTANFKNLFHKITVTTSSHSNSKGFANKCHLLLKDLPPLCPNVSRSSWHTSIHWPGITSQTLMTSSFCRNWCMMKMNLCFRLLTFLIQTKTTRTWSTHYREFWRSLRQWDFTYNLFKQPASITMAGDTKSTSSKLTKDLGRHSTVKELTLAGKTHILNQLKVTTDTNPAISSSSPSRGSTWLKMLSFAQKAAMSLGPLLRCTM